MGSSHPIQDWRNDYEMVPKSHFEPKKVTLRHKVNQDRHQLVTLYLSDEEDIQKLVARLRKREALNSKYLVPIEKVYHRQEKNLCGNNLRYELVIPEAESTLQEHFNYRKIKQEHFSDEQVMHVIQVACLALRDVHSIEDQHGNLTLSSLILNKRLLVEDPIYLMREQDSQAYAAKKIVGYPSPAILFNQYDSGLRIDKFKEDLFSVGIIALQLLNPELNIKSVYQNKSRKYENPKVNFEMITQLVNSVRHRPLQQCLATLLHPSSEERTTIYSRIQTSNIDVSRLKLLMENPRMITPQEELARSQEPPPMPSQYTHPIESSEVMSYPQPQLALSTNNSQMLLDSRSSSLLNQNVRFSRQKVSMQTVPSAQTLNSNAVLETRQMQYNTPTFYIDPAMSSRSQISKSNIGTSAFVIPPSFTHQVPSTINRSVNYPLKSSATIATQPILHYQQKQPLAHHQSHFTVQNVQREDTQSMTSPIKNFDLLMNSYYREIPNNKYPNSDALITSGLGEVRNKRIEPANKQSSEISYQLKKELAQLEEITRQNEELQKRLKYNASEVFQTSLLPLPTQQIMEVTEEDSKVEENSFMIENYEDGTRYEGFMKDHVRNGYGKFYYKSGSVYDGEWKDNLMNGYGTLYYPEGKIAYQGHWQDDQFNGKGTIYNDNPQLIKGSFDYTDFHKLEPDQWQVYEGECKDSKKHGKGKLTLSNMEMYEGQFEMDMPHGSGVFTQLRGNKIRGVWSDGLLKTIVD